MKSADARCRSDEIAVERRSGHGGSQGDGAALVVETRHALANHLFGQRQWLAGVCGRIGHAPVHHADPARLVQHVDDLLEQQGIAARMLDKPVEQPLLDPTRLVDF